MSKSAAEKDIKFVEVKETSESASGYRRFNIGPTCFDSAYVDFLVDGGFIEDGGIYDITSPEFVKSIMNTKTHFTVEHCDYWQDNEKIGNLFYCDVVVNNQFFFNFGSGVGKPVEGKFGKVCLTYRNNIVWLYKVNGKYYEKRSLMQRVPQTIRITKDGYYALNGNIECVSIGKKYESNADDIYLFARNAPWLSENSYVNYCTKYTNVCKSLKCLNESKFTNFFKF